MFLTNYLICWYSFFFKINLFLDYVKRLIKIDPFVAVRKAEQLPTWSATATHQAWGGWARHWRNCTELLEAGHGSVLFTASEWWALAWWFQRGHVHHALFGAHYICTKRHYLFFFFFSLLSSALLWIYKTYFHVHMQIFALYVTGSLNVVISPEHQHEICRYIYNHQAWHNSLGLYLSLRPCCRQALHQIIRFFMYNKALVLLINK